MNIRKSFLSFLSFFSFLSLGVFMFVFAPIVSAEISQEEMAGEISTAVGRTRDANFTANGQVKFSVKGSTEDFSSFDIIYDSGLISGQKNENTFAVSTHNEVFSVDIKKSENSDLQAEDFLFPMNISGKYAGSFIADLDALKFAVKFHYSDVSVTGNSRLENVVIGALELMEPLDNKWIEVNFAQLFEEFPEILDDYEDTQYAINKYLEAEFSGEFEEVLLLEAIEEGVLTISKSGNIYTIESQNPRFLAMIGGETAVITLTVNSRQVITDFSIHASIDVPTDGADKISGELLTQIHFDYGRNTIAWPVFQKNDWEVTKILRMFFEFAQAELDLELAQAEHDFEFAQDVDYIENLFWYNLEEVTMLQEANPIDIYELELLIDEYSELNIYAYLQRNAKMLDKNLGAGDILFLARKSGIDLDYSEIAEIRDIFAFSDRSYYNDSVSKGEKILEIFIDKQYSYQPWNVSIDEDRVYQLKTKKDFIQFLARALLAE